MLAIGNLQQSHRSSFLCCPAPGSKAPRIEAQPDLTKFS
jgi:hypothetical protein